VGEDGCDGVRAVRTVLVGGYAPGEEHVEFGEEEDGVGYGDVKDGEGGEVGGFGDGVEELGGIKRLQRRRVGGLLPLHLPW